jgi:hypothetical protein
MDGSLIEPHAFAHSPDLMPGSQVKVDLCKTYDVDLGVVMYCSDGGNWVGESSSMAYTVVKKYSWKDCHEQREHELKQFDSTSTQCPATQGSGAPSSNAPMRHSDEDSPRPCSATMSLNLIKTKSRIHCKTFVRAAGQPVWK